MHFQKVVRSILVAVPCQLLLPEICQSEVVVRMETSLGGIDVELFDRDAPITVTNFLNYVRRGDYDNSFIHRSALNPYIIQGGGYVYENGAYSQVPADPPIANEYDGFSRANERGTIAMAKLAGNPDSATNQWFFNIGNNASTLGPLNNGGFTVFGRVRGSDNDTVVTNDGASMAVVDAIALPNLRFNGTTINSPYSGAFSEIPLLGYAAGQTFDPATNLIFVRTVRETHYLLRVTSQAGNDVAITVPTPATLANLVASDTPAAAGMPAGVTFTEGFFSFEVNGIAAGGSVSVAMELPENFTPNTYYMYGPTPDNASPHWHEFKFDGRTGAEFFGNNYVVLHFIDGERGDADLSANGSITDPGAPGIAPVPASSSGGGGCTVSVNDQATGIRLDLWLIAAGLTGLAVRRRPLQQCIARSGAAKAGAANILMRHSCHATVSDKPTVRKSRFRASCT